MSAPVKIASGVIYDGEKLYWATTTIDGNGNDMLDEHGRVVKEKMEFPSRTFGVDDPSEGFYTFDGGNYLAVVDPKGMVTVQKKR